ncbi:MAG: alpha/beta fold hydrolase [Terriglobales bacterium]
MKDHSIAGGGGVGLHLVESGNPNGRPVLFLHGFSQCSKAWLRQLDSELADDFRLLAMDIRGHGSSEKPGDGYAESKFWADDVQAAITALKLVQPILCGWSYGPLIILDYLRHYGESDLGGMVFVGGVTGLGTEKVMSTLTPEFLGLIPGFFSNQADENRRSLGSLVRLCLLREPSAEDFEQMLEYNLAVPSYVRRALFSRSLDNDDVLGKIRKPVLIIQGAEDAIVKPAAIEQHKAALPHAQVRIMPRAGHAAFWDDPAGFNRHLREFSELCKSAAAA